MHKHFIKTLIYWLVGNKENKPFTFMKKNIKLITKDFKKLYSGLYYYWK